MPDANASPIKICEGLYPEAERLWSELNLKPKYGFKILNGPPIQNAEILFVGYQPGGRAEDWEEEQNIIVHNGRGTHKGWPLECEYATAKWRLGPKMRRVFGEDRLRQCVGTNVIFLRYPNEACYRCNIIGEQRQNIEQFCKERLETIVKAINPKRIITIGFKALEMFGPTEPELPRNKKGALTKVGQIANRPAVGMIHLASAYPSNAELDQLADHFRS